MPANNVAIQRDQVKEIGVNAKETFEIDLYTEDQNNSITNSNQQENNQIINN